MSDMRIVDLRLEREAERTETAERKTLALIGQTVPREEWRFFMAILGLDGAEIRLKTTLKRERDRARRISDRRSA